MSRPSRIHLQSKHTRRRKQYEESYKNLNKLIFLNLLTLIIFVCLFVCINWNIFIQCMANSNKIRFLLIYINFNTKFIN